MRRSPPAPTAAHPIFDALFRGLVIESVVDPNHPDQLRFDTWDGRKAQVVKSARLGDAEFTPAPVVRGMARAVHFPPASRSFGSAAKLARSIQRFFSYYAHLPLDAAALLTAFTLATWFSDCLSVAPLLFLLGDEQQASLILRLLGAVCRRSILLADVDVAALRSLPGGLHATLLIKHRDLPRGVNRFLLASADPHFLVACGANELNTCGAKALSADGESVNGVGVGLSFSPQVEPLPLLSKAGLQKLTNDFQAKLVRYRQENCQRVCDTQPETEEPALAGQNEVRAWMAPLSEFPNLREAVLNSFLERNQEVEANRLTDNRCLAAEAAFFFCHNAERRAFYVGQLAQKINDLLLGRHEYRVITNKKAGCLLRELGIRPDRGAKGYRVSLSDSVRMKIHDQARAYGVTPTGGDLVKCALCVEKKRPAN